MLNSLLSGPLLAGMRRIYPQTWRVFLELQRRTGSSTRQTVWCVLGLNHRKIPYRREQVDCRDSAHTDMSSLHTGNHGFWPTESLLLPEGAKDYRRISEGQEFGYKRIIILWFLQAYILESPWFCLQQYWQFVMLLVPLWPPQLCWSSKLLIKCSDPSSGYCHMLPRSKVIPGTYAKVMVISAFRIRIVNPNLLGATCPSSSFQILMSKVACSCPGLRWRTHWNSHC